MIAAPRGCRRRGVAADAGAARHRRGGRRPGRGHRRRRDRQDARHRRAGALAAGDEGATFAGNGGLVPAEPAPRHGNPFDGPLVPEQLLVLTYNVKAARELQDRLDAAVGPAARARMSVSNFHSFCQHVLTESSADAGLPRTPRCWTASGQLLLLRGHAGPAGPRATTRTTRYADFVKFINRAKDELVTPDDFDAWVDTERAIYEGRYGDVRGRRGAPAAAPAASAGSTTRAASTPACAPGSAPRTPAPCRPRAPARSPGSPRARPPSRSARPAASSPATATRTPMSHFEPEESGDRIGQLAADYERDGAAFEILRLDELARVYRAYEEALAARGALDFGEQIALVDPPVQGAPQRPAPLAAPVPLHPGGRVPGRQRRPDRAHRAAGPHPGPPRQRDGGGGRRPVHLPLPRRQLRRLRGVRRAVLASRPRTTRTARRPARPAASPSSRTSAPSATCSTAPTG